MFAFLTSSHRKLPFTEVTAKTKYIARVLINSSINIITLSSNQAMPNVTKVKFTLEHL